MIYFYVCGQPTHAYTVESTDAKPAEKKSPPTVQNEHVILVHGLARSPDTMKPMAAALKELGYQTTILSYPSRLLIFYTLSLRIYILQNAFYVF